MDISSLNRWQRMRVVALAVGCGADFNKLHSNFNNNKNQLQQEDACSICNSPSRNKNEIKIPFASPARSLVDKHFDALAQTMSEIGIEWTVETGHDDDDHHHHQKDLILKFFASNDEMNEKKEATCFLCSLAKICNNNNNNNNFSQDQELLSDDAATEANCWWWNEKYSPNYINMETGDIGPSDPKEDFLVKPLQSWGENCRFVLNTISQRLANIVVSKEKTAQERYRNGNDDEDEDETNSTPPDEETLSRRMQDAISHSEVLKTLAEKFASDKVVVNVSVNLQNQEVVVSFDSRSEENESVFTSGGFNRTRVTMIANSESNRCFTDQIMKSPFSYSLFLFQIISKITSAFADEVLRGSENDNQEKNKNLLIASLTAATFSDARRRQSATAAPAVSQSNNPMMAMMRNPNSALPQLQQQQQVPSSGLPPMMMAMLNSVTNNVAANNIQHQQPTSSSSSSQADNFLAMVMAGRKGAAAVTTTTSTSSVDEDQKKNETSINEEQQNPSCQEATPAVGNSSVEAILARIEQQKQLMLMSQPTQKNESMPAPPPPFLIPLSYFEEMLVLGENTQHEHYPSFHQLRYRVELEDHEEEELTNYLFEKPTYVGEFGNFLRSITAKKEK